VTLNESDTSGPIMWLYFKSLSAHLIVYYLDIAHSVEVMYTLQRPIAVSGE